MTTTVLLLVVGGPILFSLGFVAGCWWRSKWADVEIEDFRRENEEIRRRCSHLQQDIAFRNTQPKDHP